MKISINEPLTLDEIKLIINSTAFDSDKPFRRIVERAECPELDHYVFGGISNVTEEIIVSKNTTFIELIKIIQIHAYRRGAQYGGEKIDSINRLYQFTLETKSDLEQIKSNLRKMESILKNENGLP